MRGFTVPNSRNLEKCTTYLFSLFWAISFIQNFPYFIDQNTVNVLVLCITVPQRNKDQKKMSNIYKIIIIHVLHVYVYYCNSLVVKKLESFLRRKM